MTASAKPTFARDDDGLIIGLEHPRDSLGRVSWRSMILPQHLYVSPDYETEVKVRQNVKTKWDVDVTKCEDKELLISLAGLKYLARLRGVISVRAHDLHVTPESVTSVCTIEFSPNFENPDGLVISAQASASLHSVSGKFQLYLAAFAQNRAFTRACKDALGIEILGFEEVDFKASKAFEEALKKGDNLLTTATSAPQVEEPSKTITNFDVSGFLSGVCAKLDKNGSHSFEKIKEHAITIKAELEGDPTKWTSFDSIDRRDASVLVFKINDAAEKRAKKK